MPTKLTPEIISAAILGFEEQKRLIDARIADLRAELTGAPAASAVAPEAPTRKRKTFSAAARRKMAMAQKARWAKIKGESQPSAPAKESPKPKRRLSRAGRAAIVEATKRRWALKRAEAAKAQRVAKKAASVQSKTEAAS